MARFATTPGVYIKEQNAFTGSVVGVPTAVPAFVGYTEKTTEEPVKINSMAEYKAVFGGAPKTSFKVARSKEGALSVTQDKGSAHYLYHSIRLFFMNGGGQCYVQSVGTYDSAVSKEKLQEGLDMLLSEEEPTLLVVPDAVALSADQCYDTYQHMLSHCGTVKSRMAIFDVHGANGKNMSVVDDFRSKIGMRSLAYGAAYYPWLKTQVIAKGRLTYKNISNDKELVKMLLEEARRRFWPESMNTPAKPAAKADAKAKQPASAMSRGERQFNDAKMMIEQVTKGGATKTVDQNLKRISPMYNEMVDMMHSIVNVLPPSGAIAGVYALVDEQVGVQKAPANISLRSVLAPTRNISAEEQQDLNVPITGLSINAIRAFSRGIVVWGARTLDGNSQDWRYINVRRTMIMLEQSIKNAVENFVFEPNAPRTWIKVRTSISNFLTSLWKQGTLVGNSPSEAYDVDLDLGSTMTPEDVLDGIMRVSVRVAIARPAEFVEITFEQKMQEGIQESEGDDDAEGDEDGENEEAGAGAEAGGAEK